MSEAMELIHRAKEIRCRLMNPPNAVKDTGINLRRNRIPLQLDPPPPTTKNSSGVLEHHLTAKVRIDIVPKPPIEPIQLRIVKVGPILRAVSRQFGISIKDIKGLKRSPQYTLPRHIAIYLARKHTGLSSPAIGRRIRAHEFEKMDHASVLHASTKIEEMMLVDTAFADVVKLLEFLVLAGYYDSNLGRSPVATITKSYLAQPGEAGLSGC